MMFEYWVEEGGYGLYELKIRLVGDASMWLGYLLTKEQCDMLANDRMTFDYAIYELTENLKHIIAKESVA